MSLVNINSEPINMNIILTGASKGIGYDTALEFAKNINGKIIAIARSEDNLKKLRDEIGNINSDCELIPLPFDLSNKDYSEIIKAAENLGHVDILINNAGYLNKRKFMELEENDWYKMFEINVFAAVRLVRELMPFMGKKGKTHIVNIGSMAGFQGSVKYAGLSAYSAAKAAIAAFSECLSAETADEDIFVNCLALGGVDTEMYREAHPGKTADVESLEMAEYIVNFAMNNDKVINGRVIPVSLANP